MGDIQIDEVSKPPSDEEMRFTFTFSLEWESGAMKLLESIPLEVRSMAVEMAEGIVENEGLDVMTDARFQKMVDEYTPPSLMDRIDTG